MVIPDALPAENHWYMGHVAVICDAQQALKEND